MNEGSKTEQKLEKNKTPHVKLKTKRCPNCGQIIVINGITECKWCGWPLLAKYPGRHIHWRKPISSIFTILAAFIVMFALMAYQGIWTHVGDLKFDMIHNSVPWLAGIGTLGVVILALSSAFRNHRFDLIFSFSKGSIAAYTQALLVAVIFPIVAAAVSVYFVHAMTSKNDSNFDLAIVSATIGGLVMVGGFIDKVNKQQASDLINIGKWFLIASVFATLFSLFMPTLIGMDNSLSNTLSYRLLFYATAGSLLASVFSFPWAVCLLLPKLWTLGNSDPKSK